MRILAIDYGEKRIGLAVSDEMGITARGISVIERKSKQADLDAIAAAVSEYGVGAIVVGYPLRLDGSAGIQCGKVDRFIASLREVISVPVIAWDETLVDERSRGADARGGREAQKEAGHGGPDRRRRHPAGLPEPKGPSRRLTPGSRGQQP